MQSFLGSQRLSPSSTLRPSTAAEDWKLAVRVHGVDLLRGRLFGTMEALNIPQASSPVVTAWEGEIIDNHNFTFVTSKWGATSDVDMKHWHKFQGFASMENEVMMNSGRSSQLASSAFIFMRWKETFFVNNEGCGLTIAGFYYGKGRLLYMQCLELHVYMVLVFP